MIQNTLNRILNLSPYYLQYLEEVAGLTLEVEITDLPIKCGLVFHHSFIEVKPRPADPKLRLSGKTVDFICFAMQGEQRQKLLQTERIRFEGDLLVLQKIEQFLNHFDLKYFAAFPLPKIKRVLANQREYWQEEKQILASPILFDYFKDEVLLLQQDLDRLEARFQAYKLL